MESLNYTYLRKCWVIPLLILIILIASNFVSADVSISNSYSTSGGETHESIFLDNMNYSNNAGVYGDSYSASSTASTANESEMSKFTDTAYGSSWQGSQGYVLQAGGSKDMGYSRSLSGGSNPFTSLSYNLETNDSSGALHIKYYSPNSSFDDNIYNLVNNKYEGSLQSYGSTIFASGRGRSNNTAPSSFNDIISYMILDKDCKMDSYLIKQGGDKPLDYLWKTFLNQGSSQSVTGINISATEGDTVKAEITGSSSFLKNKHSPIYMRYVFR